MSASPARSLLAPAAAVGLAVLAAACGSKNPDAAGLEKPRSLPVNVVAVSARDIEDRLVLSGTLGPRRQVALVSEVAARLLSIARDEGSRVAAGDVVASLDETDYRLAQDRSRAALAVADANRAHALVERERADSLLQTGGITDKDRLAAEVSLQVAEASLLQARAEVAITALHLSRCQMRAPFSGRVAKRQADPGAMLTVGATVVTLVDDAVLEFRAEVPSADYGKLKLGAQVSVSVDAMPGYAAEGKLARIVPLVDDRNRTFEAVVAVRNDEKLVAGLFARASVRVGAVTGALVVPPSALLRDGSDPSSAEVFVVVAGKAERRSVKLGVEAADVIQVREGLEQGDQVVLDPPATLASGSLVEARRSEK